MEFNRPHHNLIFKLLTSLNSKFLQDCSAYFGGGTLLALKYDEYRLSVDVDFLCQSGEGYGRFRRGVFEEGYNSIFLKTDGLAFPRDIRADQYGVRFPVLVNDTQIKFEVISESRITLSVPNQYDWCPVACLSNDDSASEKLLANADRWADKSTFSRDLIDLSVIRAKDGISCNAYSKAEKAYPTFLPLSRSIDHFTTDHEYRARCFEMQEIDTEVQDIVLKGIEFLQEDLQGRLGNQG